MLLLQIFSVLFLVAACGIDDSETPKVSTAATPAAAEISPAPSADPVAVRAAAPTQETAFTISEPIAPPAYGGLWSRRITVNGENAALSIVEKRMPGQDWQVVGALNNEGKYLDGDISKIFEYRVGTTLLIPAQPAAFDQVVNVIPCDGNKVTLNAYRVVLTGNLQFLCSPTTFINGDVVVIDTKLGLGPDELVITTKSLQFSERGILQSFIPASELNPAERTAPAVSWGSGGRSAGILKISADKTVGKIHITSLAENGEAGENGNQGVRGANGARGGDYTDVVDEDDPKHHICTSLATWGGAGQNGGAGGNGAPGHAGGNSLRLVISIPNLVLAEHDIKIFPGKGGRGGVGGFGGGPGTFGDHGATSNFCPGLGNTIPKLAAPGPAGMPGEDGVDGISFPIEFLVP